MEDHGSWTTMPLTGAKRKDLRDRDVPKHLKIKHLMDEYNVWDEVFHFCNAKHYDLAAMNCEQEMAVVGRKIATFFDVEEK